MAIFMKRHMWGLCESVKAVTNERGGTLAG